MAITASKGWEGIVVTTVGWRLVVVVVVAEAGAGVVVREGKGEPKVSPPRRSVAVAPAWTREPIITLSNGKGQTYLDSRASGFAYLETAIGSS